jgi:hypothetical protein
MRRTHAAFLGLTLLALLGCDGAPSALDAGEEPTDARILADGRVITDAGESVEGGTETGPLRLEILDPLDDANLRATPDPEYKTTTPTYTVRYDVRARLSGEGADAYETLQAQSSNSFVFWSAPLEDGADGRYATFPRVLVAFSRPGEPPTVYGIQVTTPGGAGVPDAIDQVLVVVLAPDAE